MAKTAKSMNLALLTSKKPHISNAEIEARKAAENALKVAKDKLKAPSWLDKTAKGFFRHVVNEMSELDVLNNLDLHALAIMANVYSQYVACNKQIEEDGLLVSANKSSETTVAAHPLFVKQNHLFQQLRLMQVEFGLTPSGRSKLALNEVKGKMPTNNTRDKFGGV